MDRYNGYWLLDVWSIQLICGVVGPISSHEMYGEKKIFRDASMEYETLYVWSVYIEDGLIVSTNCAEPLILMFVTFIRWCLWVSEFVTTWHAWSDILWDDTVISNPSSQFIVSLATSMPSCSISCIFQLFDLRFYINHLFFRASMLE